MLLLLLLLLQLLLLLLLRVLLPGPSPFLPAVVAGLPSWLCAHPTRCSLRLSSAAPSVLWAVPLRLLQTRVLWPRLPAAQQHSGGSCGRTAPLHTSVMAPLGAVWENDFNPSRQKQISYISSVRTDQAEVKRLLFFPAGQQRRLTLIYPSNGRDCITSPWQQFRVGAKLQPLACPPNTKLRQKGWGAGRISYLTSGVLTVNDFSTRLKLGVGKFFFSDL